MDFYLIATHILALTAGVLVGILIGRRFPEAKLMDEINKLRDKFK